MSPDGVERQEVSMEGAGQEVVQVEEGDVFSRVVKRTVVRSHGDQKEVCTARSFWGLKVQIIPLHLEGAIEIC